MRGRAATAYIEPETNSKSVAAIFFVGKNSSFKQSFEGRDNPKQFLYYF